MSSTYCIVHKEMTVDCPSSLLTFKKHIHLFEIKRKLQNHRFYLCILQQEYSGSPLGRITTARSEAESHLDLWVRLWSDPHHSLVISINFNNLQISSYRVLRLQATRVCVSVCFVCATEITKVMWASVGWWLILMITNYWMIVSFSFIRQLSTFNNEPHTVSLLTVRVPHFFPTSGTTGTTISITICHNVTHIFLISLQPRICSYGCFFFSF